MNFKYFSIIFMTLMAFVAIYLFIRHDNQKKTISEQEFLLKENENKNKLLNNIILLHGRCIDLKIDTNSIVVDETGNGFLLKELIKKTVTIYRLNESNCFTCIERFLPELETISKTQTGSILGTYSNPRNLFLSLKEYIPKQIAVYNIEKGYLDKSKIENIDMPYIFDIDSNLNASNFFIPQKEVQKLSVYYQENHF
jgi:hypothetical protein